MFSQVYTCTRSVEAGKSGLVPQGIAGERWTEKRGNSFSGEAFSEFAVSWSLCFPGSAAVKNSPASAAAPGDGGLVLGLGRCPEGGNGSPLQCSCLENPIDRSPVGYSPKSLSQTQLSTSMCRQDIEYSSLLCSKPLLFICFTYSCLYLPIPNSSFISYPSSSLVTLSLFSMSVSLFLFCK